MALATLNPVLVVALAYWVLILVIVLGYCIRTRFWRQWAQPDYNKVLIKGGLTCTICGKDADVYLDRYQCQGDPHHLAFKGDKEMFVGSILRGP